MSLLRGGGGRGSPWTFSRSRRCGGRRRRRSISVHSSARLISSKRALRWLRCSRLSRGGRLLKAMLGRLLILGRGRGKTGATTSLIGHDTTKQIAWPMAQCRRGSLRRAGMLCRTANMRSNGLDATRFELVSQHPDFGFIILFHLNLRLLKLVDFLPNHLHFLELSG
jgi:hypothetical protein